MQVFDSCRREKVEFKPRNDEFVTMYLCGPTVYDEAHLGHAKSSVSFDLLVRVLKASGKQVVWARNYTDIDDKILAKMQQSGKSLEEITSFYIARYEEQMRALNVSEPTFKPLATQYVSAMVGLIERLVSRGAAYILQDGVYFSVGSDTGYLTLSGRDANAQNQARVASAEGKRDERDFVLWKFDEEWFESPWGRGRPGWHTECVAMIESLFSNSNLTKFFEQNEAANLSKPNLTAGCGEGLAGEKFLLDIHAGGADLLFPHHENEASQCRQAFCCELAKYWLHNGFVQVDGEKMSKSLKNYFLIQDALKIAPAEALRFYLLSVHYRANFNYNEEDLLASKKRLDKIYRLKKRLSQTAGEGKRDERLCAEILAFLQDDLNVSAALSLVDLFISNTNAALDANPKDKAAKLQAAATLRWIEELFGVGLADENEWFCFGVDEAFRAEISRLILQRSEAKKAKDYAKADEIRKALLERKIALMDTPNGVVWEKIED